MAPQLAEGLDPSQHRSDSPKLVDGARWEQSSGNASRSLLLMTVVRTITWGCGHGRRYRGIRAAAASGSATLGSSIRSTAGVTVTSGREAVGVSSEERDPRRALVPDDIHIAIERINSDFYRQRPHSYLLHRVQALTMLCGRPDVVSETLAAGIDLAGISMTYPNWSPELADHLDFLTLEAEVLLFQTAEALLRLVLAHAPTDESSPALNQAALKSHTKFYRRLEQLIRDASDESLDHIVINTIHGTDSIAPLQMEPIDGQGGKLEPSQAGLEEGRANLRGLLRYLADYVLSDDCRDVYNSAKHGLATRTGNFGFRLGGGDGQRPITDQSGQALMCIAVGKRDEHGELPVDNVVVWSNPAEALGVIYMSLHAMDAVWQLGKLRQTKQEPDEGFCFRTFEGYSVDTIRQAAYDLGPSRGEGFAFATIPHFRLPTGVVL